MSWDAVSSSTTLGLTLVISSMMETLPGASTSPGLMSTTPTEMEATNQESYERDYTEFLEELEEDKLFRQNVNIYFSEYLSLSLFLSLCMCYVDDACFSSLL